MIRLYKVTIKNALFFLIFWFPKRFSNVSLTRGMPVRLTEYLFITIPFRCDVATTRDRIKNIRGVN